MAERNYLKINGQNEIHEFAINCTFDIEKVDCNSEERCRGYMMKKCPLGIIKENISIYSKKDSWLK